MPFFSSSLPLLFLNIVKTAVNAHLFFSLLVVYSFLLLVIQNFLAPAMCTKLHACFVQGNLQIDVNIRAHPGSLHNLSLKRLHYHHSVFWRSADLSGQARSHLILYTLMYCYSSNFQKSSRPHRGTGRTYPPSIPTSQAHCNNVQQHDIEEDEIYFNIALCYTILNKDEQCILQYHI